MKANAGIERGFPRAALELTQPRVDFFPTTHLTGLLTELRAAPEGEAHARLAALVMTRYAHPLELYARGSTLRFIAEPLDLVHGFFASALADPAYFARYHASGMRLRRWLMNGLLLHARSVARDRAQLHRSGDGTNARPAADG